MPPEIAYLKAWLDWVDHGAPDGYPFFRDTGLCGNLCRFSPDYRVNERFKGLLYYEFGRNDYPFGGPHLFTIHSRNKTHHTNTQRIAWVRSILERYDA